MPIYKNTSSEIVTIGGNRVEVNAQYETLGFVDEISLGITKLDNMPAYNPIILAQKVTGTTTIAIPQQYTRFAVHFYVKTGEPSILFSDNSNTPPLLLYPLARWNMRFYERMINDIRITGTSLEMWVIIEKI